MSQRKVLFMVAVGGILAQASETSLKNSDHSSFLRQHPSSRRHVDIGKTEVPHHAVPGAYLFSSSVSDPSRGFFQSRSEARSQNGKVKGEYSYMDGFYKVKVAYLAGPKGFRVIRQERIPLKKPTLLSTPTSAEQERHRNVKLSN